MRQYFVEKKLEINEIFDFNEKQSHHIKTVLRMKVGEKIRVVDSNNDVFLVEIDIDSKVRGKVLENIFDLSDVSEITYCAALIKKDKWNFLLQKAAELGATKVVPLISNRTIFKIDEQRLEKRIQRWNKITLEACQQSNRSSKCEVERPIKLKEIDKFLSENNIVAYENEQNICLADCLIKSITFVIGPEGG